MSTKQRIRITLEIEAQEVPGYADLRTAIHYTLADALGEFRRSRLPVADYVAARYAEHDEKYQAGKVGEVAARGRLAEALRVSINEPQAIEERP